MNQLDNSTFSSRNPKFMHTLGFISVLVLMAAIGKPYTEEEFKAGSKCVIISDGSGIVGTVLKQLGNHSYLIHAAGTDKDEVHNVSVFDTLEVTCDRYFDKLRSKQSW